MLRCHAIPGWRPSWPFAGCLPSVSLYCCRSLKETVESWVICPTNLRCPDSRPPSVRWVLCTPGTYCTARSPFNPRDFARSSSGARRGGGTTLWRRGVFPDSDTQERRAFAPSSTVGSGKVGPKAHWRSFRLSHERLSVCDLCYRNVHVVSLRADV